MTCVLESLNRMPSVAVAYSFERVASFEPWLSLFYACYFLKIRPRDIGFRLFDEAVSCLSDFWFTTLIDGG
jgi:hypothetical protein